MSEVYVWQFSDSFRVFEGVDENHDRYLDKVSLQRFEGDWVSPSLKDASEGGKKKTVGDFPATTGFCHLVSSRVVDALGEMLTSTGELYEVYVADDDIDEAYYLYQCTNIIDCLDVGKSKIKYSPIRPDEVIMVMDSVFHASKVPDDGLFIVPEDKTGHVYVTESVKDQVKEAGLKGMVLSGLQFNAGNVWVS